MAKVKCKFCNIQDEKTSMTKVDSRYVHNDCLDEYNSEIEFKKKEHKDLAKLMEYIKKVHNIEVIPNQFYPFIQDLRNGNARRGKIIGTQKYKEGYSYYVIALTYKYIKPQIKWAIRNKNFNGSSSMLRYTYAILVDKISVVNKKLIRKQEKDASEDSAIKHVQETVGSFGGTSYKYKKQKKTDISKLLG